MNEKTGFIFYIDILGYKNILSRNTVKDDEHMRNILNRFTQIFSRLDFVLGYGAKFDKNKWLKKCFSDNFLFLYESEENNLDNLMIFQAVASQIQHQFLLEGILTRGAISYGTIHYNDDIVYGLDLIKVVVMEENHREPSVIVDERFQSLMENHNLEFRKTIDLFFTHAESELDFENCVAGIKRYLEYLNESNVDERVLDKIKWVIDRLNDYFGKEQKTYYELKCETKYSLVEKKEGEIQ